ncbi:hypothetical protein U1Q18_027431 [Sarracenia purpurea var. burkii]
MKKSCSDGSLGKPDRKTVERNRRIIMKDLHCKLTSLVPPHHFKPSKDALSQQDQLDQVAVYIKQLKERVDELNAKRAAAMGGSATTKSPIGDRMEESSGTIRRLPVVQLRDLGSSLEVVMISGLPKNFMLYEVIGVLQDEGADVVSASFATMGDMVFYTLHAQVKVCRVGVETSRVHQRLQELIS